MKHKGAEFGLSLAGVGVGLATFVADQAGLDLPTGLLIGLGVCAFGMIVGGLLVPFSSKRAAGDALDPCGDPKARRAELTFSAERLETELGRFENWWPAVADTDFDGRLKDGFETTHEEAVQALSYAFAYFFSAAWIYEKQCRGHHGRRRKQVLDLVGEVYLALGANSSGDTDATVDSLQLMAIAKRSTRYAGEARAQTMDIPDFEAQLKDNPTFAAHFQPLVKFLIAAAQGGQARARMAKTEEAVKRVKEKLT